MPPQSEPIRLSIVVPAFNEVGRLPATLRQISVFLEGREDLAPAEILVVDDGSSDGTAEAVGHLPMPSRISLEVLHHPTNRGKGAAVRTGFGRSRGDLVLLSDADLAAPIEEVDLLVAHARDGGIAIGSRAVNRRLIMAHQPWYRDLMGRSFNIAVRVLALQGVGDTQCGFKLYPGPLARALAHVQRIDGFAFDVELLVLCRSWGVLIHEVPVRWRHVEASRVQPFRHSCSMMADLMRIAWWRLARRLPARPPSLELRWSVPS